MRQAPAAERAVVQLRDGRLCGLVRGHFDEGESARAARFTVPHDVHRFHRAGLGKQFLQIVFVGFEGDVPDVQLATHDTSSCIQWMCPQRAST